MIWGGLRPIRRQLLVDSLAIAGAIGALYSIPSSLALILSFLLIYATCGMTKRWPISFPLMALLGLQTIRWFLIQLVLASHIISTDTTTRIGSMASVLFQSLQIGLIIIMIALSILFPALELPPDKGPFAVGIKDVFIPTRIKLPDGTFVDREMAARIYYPTTPIATATTPPPTTSFKHQSSSTSRPNKIRFMDYLNPQIGTAFCTHSMFQAGPPLLRSFDFMLHHWLLPKIPFYETPPMNEPCPCVIYSHGLGGCYDVYSYQPRYLTSHGKCIVLAVTHLDGSAAVAPHPNGRDVISHAYNIHYQQMDEVIYAQRRREQTDIRIQELVQAAEYMISQATTRDYGFQLENDTKCFFMGHSFGATTVLGVSARCNHLVRGVLAHEPATDWLPDDVRRRLFHGRDDYDGGTGGYRENTNNHHQQQQQLEDKSLHDDGTPILILHSDEWATKRWSHSHLIRDMHKTRHLEPSKHHVIAQSCHMEFSDTCMMTPVWLARTMGITGRRNPCDTAQEIGTVSLEFIQNVRKTSS